MKRDLKFKLGKDKALHLSIPTVVERIGLAMMVVFWYLFNDATNIISASPFNMFSVGNIWGNVFVLTADFVFPMFLFCTIFSVMVMSRNIYTGKTHKNFDLYAGIILIVSLMLMLIGSTIQMMGGGTTFPVYWIFGMPKATLFHIGVAGFWFSWIYYLLFD